MHFEYYTCMCVDTHVFFAVAKQKAMRRWPMVAKETVHVDSDSEFTAPRIRSCCVWEGDDGVGHLALIVCGVHAGVMWPV